VGVWGGGPGGGWCTAPKQAVCCARDFCTCARVSSLQTASIPAHLSGDQAPHAAAHDALQEPPVRSAAATRGVPLAEACTEGEPQAPALNQPRSSPKGAEGLSPGRAPETPGRKGAPRGGEPALESGAAQQAQARVEGQEPPLGLARCGLLGGAAHGGGVLGAALREPRAQAANLVAGRACRRRRVCPETVDLRGGCCGGQACSCHWEPRVKGSAGAAS